MVFQNKSHQLRIDVGLELIVEVQADGQWLNGYVLGSGRVFQEHQAVITSIVKDIGSIQTDAQAVRPET